MNSHDISQNNKQNYNQGRKSLQVKFKNKNTLKKKENYNMDADDKNLGNNDIDYDSGIENNDSEKK